MSTFFFLTQFVQEILGYSPIRAGLAFLPMAVMIGVSAQFVARLVGRIGVRPPLLIGPAFASAGLFWVSRISVGSGYLDLLGPLVCVAIGMGLSFVPLTLTAVGGVAPNETGLASALLNSGQQVGSAVGLALLSTVSVAAFKNHLTTLATTNHGRVTTADVHTALVYGWDRGFLVAAGIGVLALAISASVIRGRPAEQPAVSGAQLAEVTG
jgi:MFS family permease